MAQLHRGCKVEGNSQAKQVEEYVVVGMYSGTISGFFSLFSGSRLGCFNSYYYTKLCPWPAGSFVVEDLPAIYMFYGSLLLRAVAKTFRLLPCLSFIVVYHRLFGYLPDWQYCTATVRW